jgi:hypothetical protein
MTRLLLLAVLALLPSCFVSRETTNVPLYEDRFAGLQPGVTTATDVVRLLGAPNEIVQLARRSAYRYEFDQRKSAALFLLVINFVNADVRADRAWLFFDENDVLTHVGTTFEAKDARYAMPWWNIHKD